MRVCAMSELLPGESTVAWDGDTPILVFNLDGELYALEDRCSHEDFELSAGSLTRRPAPSSARCMAPGSTCAMARHCARPAYEPVAKFPVKREDDAIWTRDDRDD